MATVIIPQAWVDRYHSLPDSWMAMHAPGLWVHEPNMPIIIDSVACAVDVDPRLLVTRMELEQGAITYPWDGTTHDYGGGKEGEREKLRWLCGVDKTDSGPRSGAWEGPERQLTGCALRFKFWYRGRDGVTTDGRAPDAWKNWLGLREDPRFAPDVAVTRDGLTIVPGNQASADCLRFTSSLPASLRLREIGLRWFPEDYLEEEQRVMSRETVIVLDPGHSDYTHEFPGGYREGRLVRLAAIEAEKLLEAEGHRVVLTRTTSGDDPSLTYRGTLAVREGARVFVSLHTDAASDAAARGVHAIFYATSKSDASAPDHQIAAPNGRALARAIAQEVASSLGLPLRSASTGGAAPWWRCPSNLGVLTGGGNWRITEATCLVEAGFGSSPSDRAVLSRDDAPMRYAIGVCRGIYRYCGWDIPVAWGGTAEPAPETPSEPEAPIPPADSWSHEINDAVAWARLRGVSDGTRLSDPLTRAEALVMLRRLETLEGEEVTQ